MAYIEVSDVMFRGELRGATGQARFKLTAKAIDAVDTVNIAGNQVTYNFYFRYSSIAVSAGGVMLSGTIDVPDNNAWVEIIAYGHGASAVQVNGVTRPNRNRRGPSFELLPFVEIIPLAKGTHTVRLISSFTGTSANGYIFCRYIRNTGLANT